MSDYLEEAKKELEFARKDTGGVTVAIACALVAIAERPEELTHLEKELKAWSCQVQKDLGALKEFSSRIDREIEFTKRQQTADMDRITELERRFIYIEAQSGCPCGGMVEDCELCGGVENTETPDRAENLALKSRVDYLETQDASGALTALVASQALKIEQLEARVSHIERRSVDIDFDHQIDRIGKLEGKEAKDR